MADSTKAVFLSYASQDAEAAKRIADALRASGVEVWFDAEGGLEHGDEWDAKIRRQIKECVLFIAVISANTEARDEGYFRIEWDLAAERARGIASGVAFILPVLIDGTREPDALVPDRFRTVQWTKLPGGTVPPEVLQRFLKLWSHRTGALKNESALASTTPVHTASSAVKTIGNPSAKNYALIAVAVGAIVAGVGWWLLGGRKKPAAPPPAPIATAAPVKSIPAAAPRSEARQLADRAFAMSVDKYDSTLDDYNLAESLMQRALALDSSDGEILARSAQLHLMFRNRGFDYSPERIAKGREQAERAIRLVPDSAEAVYALSQAQSYTGNRAAALESLERVIAIDPNHARALLNLGASQISLGKPAEGLAFYARARQQPEWAPLADYYEFLRQFGRREFADADRLVRSSYRAGPSANNAAGIALVHLTWDGDLDTAIRELDAIPIKLRNAPRIICVTAFVQLNRRQPDEALKALDRLTDEFVQDAWSTGPKASLVGRAHAMAGRDTAARLAWESGLAVTEARLKNSPGDASYHHSRGMLLAWLGRAEEALQEARAAQELSRGAAPGWRLSEATIYAALGRADLALPLIEKLLSDHGGTGNWPITVTLLRQDPLWDKIRDEPGFQKLIEETKTEAKPSRAAAPVAQPDAQSVAVLAFANLSDDKGNEYFSDGISEELLNVLAKVPGLKVSARTSSFYFKGKEVPVPEIAKQLGVAYVVEGSVRKSGDKVRITAQLIKADGGFHVWSDTFTRDLKDIFAVQDEIAGLIAQKFKLALAGQTSGTGTINIEAFEYYLRGRQAWALRDRESLAQAEQFFREAIALQPDFVRALVGLADVWISQGDLGSLPAFRNRQSPEWVRIMEKHAEALALDPNSAEALASQANVANYRWDFATAGRLYRRAIELNPNYASAQQWYARHLALMGEMDEALKHIDLALASDPLAPRIVSNAAMIYVMAGRPAKGLELAERGLALQKNNGQAKVWKCEALLALGRARDLAEFLRSPGDEPASGPALFNLSYLIQAGVVGVSTADRAAFARFDADPDGLGDYSLVRSHLILGRRTEALGQLVPAEASYAFCEWMMYLPLFDRIRDDPAFRRFYESVGLIEAHDRAQAWRKAHPPEKPEATK